MRTPAAAAMATLLLGLSATNALAQVIVHDPTSYGRLIQQAQTALNQLNELKSQVAETKRLHDSFNQMSDVNSLATALATPAMRAFVPEIDTYVAAATGDLAALGQIGEAAQAIRDGRRLFMSPLGDALGQDLERTGDRAARDMALGQQVVTVGAQRLEGLRELTSALDTASNARAVMDIQARLSAEQAMIANDQMRLQGLAMAQEAEARLQVQRDRERARAAGAARLQLYREAFQ